VLLRGNKKTRRSGRQAGQAHMLPEQIAFIGGVGVPVAVDDAIAQQTGRGGCEQLPPVTWRCYAGIVARQRLELVLVAVDEQWNVAEVGGEVLHLGAVDQFLTLQHAAQQQADDDQHDGDFDQVKPDCLLPLRLRKVTSSTSI
jgi:hypothetical protein